MGTGAQGRTVLVVEGDGAVFDAVDRAFGETGCSTRAACDRASGIAAAREQRFSLAIVGLNGSGSLDVVSGLVRADPKLPVIAVAQNGCEGAAEALKLGAECCVRCPVEPDELRLMAEKAMEKRRLAEQYRALRRKLAAPVTASLRDVEKKHIERVLKANKWNQSASAQVLGIDRKTLRNKIREFKLRKDAKQSA